MKHLITAVFLSACGLAHAEILTFDGYDGGGQYAGLHISRLRLISAGEDGVEPFDYGTKALKGSAPEATSWPNTYSATISASYAFYFNGANVAGFFSDGYDFAANWLGIVGYRNGHKVGEVDAFNGLTFSSFVWTDGFSSPVDTLIFEATPSTRIGAGWVLDALNITAAPVPEPETWTLALVGLASIAGRYATKFSRKQQAA